MLMEKTTIRPIFFFDISRVSFLATSVLTSLAFSPVSKETGEKKLFLDVVENDSSTSLSSESPSTYFSPLLSDFQTHAPITEHQPDYISPP